MYKMSEMQQILSTLISGPSVEFDETTGVIGNNEEYYRFENNYYIGQQEGWGNTIVCDSSDNSMVTETLMRFLCGYSTDTDSNETSRKLVEEYRNELSKALGVN